jgi:hypothetical protein
MTSRTQPVWPPTSANDRRQSFPTHPTRASRALMSGQVRVSILGLLGVSGASRATFSAGGPRSSGVGL